MSHLFSLEGVDLSNLLRELQGVGLLERGLLGIDERRYVVRRVRKEPLRFRTGLSTGPVVHPVDFGHVECSLRKDGLVGASVRDSFAVESNS